MEKIALQKIKEASLNDEIIKTPRLASILYRWHDWENDDAVRRWVSQIIASDEGLVDLLSAFLSRSYSQSMGDRVAKVRWRLDPKSLEPFIDPSQLIERCKNLIASPPEWLKDERKIAVETFVRWFELRKEGRDPERDWEE